MEKIRILILEDNPADAELMERELKRGEIQYVSKRVITKEAFEKELVGFKPDIILADYSLPQFNAMEALFILECKGLAFLPFIIVTGTVKEEVAVKCARSGAWDYVIKDHMMRLSTSVRAAMTRRNAEKQRDEALTRIEKLNSTLLSFSDDYGANINKLVAVLGELLGASCALYNRLDGGMLFSLGRWQTPSDYDPKDKPDGHMCYDVIKRSPDEAFVVRNLAGTSYAKTDKNVLKYGLKTYMGGVVRVRGESVGSVCVVYDKDVDPTEGDKRFIGIIASAIAVEEDRTSSSKKLAEERDRFEAIIENTPMVAIQGFDREGVVRYWNAASERMYGFKKSSVLGKKLQEVILTEAEADNFVKSIREIWLSGKSAPMREWEIQTKTGGKKFVYSMMFPVYEGGKINLIFCMDLDVTEKKIAEAAVRDSENRFRALFDSMNEMVVLHDIVLDENGRPTDYRILDCNPAFTSVMGISRERARGELASRLYGVNEAPYLETYAGVAKTGKAECFETFFEPMGKYFNISVFSPAKGQFATVALDVTERRHAEVAIKESEEKFRLIFEYAPDAYYLLDNKGNFVDGNRNAEKLIGRPRQEVIGKSMAQAGLIAPEHVSRSLSLLAKNMMGLSTGVDEFTLIRADGARIETEITTYPVKIKGHSYVLGIARDVTERKKSQEALVRTLMELKQYKEITVGRENKMVELKKEVNRLSKELGRSEPYDVSFSE